MVMIQQSSVAVYLRKFLRFIQAAQQWKDMNMGDFNLFMKMIEEEYRLGYRELQKISRRLLADDSEFEKVWKLYRNKAPISRTGNDEFRPVLLELINS
jgi:hypothetical protein